MATQRIRERRDSDLHRVLSPENEMKARRAGEFDKLRKEGVTEDEVKVP
jgi:hypothetical protein